MKNVARSLLLLFFVSLLASAVVLAQSDLGTISGYVKDPSGATVSGAKVTLSNQSGLQRQTTTNDSGFYTVTNLPRGLYTLQVEAPGFQRYESKDNKLDTAANLVIDAQLVVGANNQTVEVSAAAVQLQTESATVEKLVTREQIDSLELNGRNPIFMANLVPGTRGGNLASLNFNFSQGPSNINGARTPESLITYDGAPAVRTRSNGTSLGAADVDSTQEIQILTTDYAAEYGRSSGGQIRVVSKAGGQDFHGAVYEYDRNTVFDANPWQRNASALTTKITAPIHYNQFGYNVGGPFYIPNHFNTGKNKVFWYWGQEWVRFVFTDTSGLTVPTLLMRQGNFSELLVKNIFTGNPVQLIDPKTGLPFPGNIIPAPGTATTGSTATPNGLGILNSYPLPNQATPIGTSNWFFSAKHPQNQRKDTYAVDLNLTSKQRLQFRRVYFSFWEYQPLDGGTNETPKYFNRPNQTNSIDHVWTLSPTKVNEVLFTFSLDQVYIPVNQAGFLDRTKGVAQGAGLFGLNYPYIFPASEKLIPTRIPTVDLGSDASRLNGGPYPSHSTGPIFDVSDSFTWIRGNHTFKFGGLFEHQGENDNDEINVQACSTCTNNQNGQFGFSDNGSNFVRPGYVAASSHASLANAALGLFDSYSEIGHRAYTVFRGNMWEGFGQDTWKVRQNLTLTLGARYTVIVPYHALWGNMIVFDPTFYNPALAPTVSPTTGLITGNPTIAQLYNGMVIPGSSFPSDASKHFPEASSGLYNGLFRGVPDHYSDIQWGDIQPRVGIAYQLNNKTVIRTGGGRFFTRLGVSDSIFLGGNPPFQPNASVSFGSVDNPGGSGTNTVPLVVTTQSKAFKNPESWAWNVTVERQLPWNSIVSVGYVAHRGLHQQREADINQPTLAQRAANSTANINAVRPYQGFGTIRRTDNVANSLYNSLQVNWSRRFNAGLQFGASYTYSKSMDNGSNQRDVVPDTYDISMLWGPSEFDVRHIFVANYLYQLPFLHGRNDVLGKVLGDWQISGIVQYQTGTPCSAIQGGGDFAGVGQDANFGCGNSGQFWVENGNPSLVKTFGPNAQWFQACLVAVPAGQTCPDGSPKFNGVDQRIFRPPVAGTFNTQRVRDILYQPGLSNWNMGLFKSFPFNERFGLQFRAEAFNVWNHPNWNGPGLNPNNLSTFGKVLTKGSGSSGAGERNLQLSLRFYF